MIRLAKNKKKIIIGDTKSKHINYFKDLTVLKPNLREACRMVGEEDSLDLSRIGRLLQKKVNAHILITLGKDGSALFEKGKKMIKISIKARNVYNVSGAGDTVIAALALSLASGATLLESAQIANLAAGIVIEKVGTAAVDINELNQAIGE